MNPMEMMKLMKQAAGMQKRLEAMQNEMNSRQFEFASGGGMVTAVVRGDMTLATIRIDPKAVDPADVEMLEDLVRTAVNGAYQTARETVQAEMAKITGGLGGGIPGM